MENFDCDQLHIQHATTPPANSSVMTRIKSSRFMLAETGGAHARLSLHVIVWIRRVNRMGDDVLESRTHRHFEIETESRQWRLEPLLIKLIDYSGFKQAGDDVVGDAL